MASWSFFGKSKAAAAQHQTQLPPPGTTDLERDQLHKDKSVGLLRSGDLGGLGKPSVWAMIFIPWFCVVAILLVTLLSCYAFFDVVWRLIVLTIVIVAAINTYRAVATQNGKLVVAALSLVACCVSLVLAFYAHELFLTEYYRIGRGASYFNVIPSEAAGGKSDATSLVFANGTQIDSSRTYGFADADNGGDVYCVAPIASTNTLSDDKIEYWAAGYDCCNQRGFFDCDDASTPGVRAGIVMEHTRKSEVGFVRAVAAAEQAHDVQAAKDYLLISWVSNPRTYRDELWFHTRTVFLAFGGVYLVLSCMLGCTLHRVLK